MYRGSLSASMSFGEAVDFYLQWRTSPVAPGRITYVGTRTLRDYRQKAKTLKKFFGDMPLSSIKVENFTGYQDARLHADGFTRMYGEREVSSPAGPDKINAELSLLKKLMVMAGCWTPMHQMYYKRFQHHDPDAVKALSAEQQHHFLSTAASLPRWHPVWWYALVALHLTFSSDEMRTLRLGDINLDHQIIGVNNNYGKNYARRRSVTIEDGACGWALLQLKARAHELCLSNEHYKGPQPHYFLFPRRVVKNLYDPELPMGETGLRKIFQEVRERAELPWFQFNAFRHTGATRLAEGGCPPYVLEQRMGHIGPKMMRRYVQIAEQAQRRVVRNALGKKPPMPVEKSILEYAQVYRSN